MTTLELHIAEHGERNHRTAVLLHSSGLSGAQWRAYLEPLAERGWRTLAVDFIGYGDSPPWPGPEPFHHRHDVAQVVELLRSLEGRTTAVVGHSYGGLVALQALCDPAVEPAVAVVFEPVAFGVLATDEAREERGRFDALLESGFLDDARGGSEAWMQQFVEYWNGPGAWEHIGPAGRAAMMRASRKTFEEVRTLSLDETPLSAYAAISTPVHLILGAASTAESRAVCRLLAGLSPSNTLTEVPGGHMTPLLAPATVIPVICSKLASALTTAE